MKSCHKCGEEWARKEQPGFKTACPKCTACLHSCLNCKLYNPSADRCSSITAECTGDREGLNYCEEFQFRDTPANGGRRGNGRGNGIGALTGLSLEERLARSDSNGAVRRPSAARNKFDQLFGSSETSSADTQEKPT